MQINMNQNTSRSLKAQVLHTRIHHAQVLQSTQVLCLNRNQLQRLTLDNTAITLSNYICNAQQGFNLELYKYPLSNLAHVQGTAKSDKDVQLRLGCHKNFEHLTVQTLKIAIYTHTLSLNIESLDLHTPLPCIFHSNLNMRPVEM